MAKWPDVSIPMKNHPHHTRNNGFTLLELVMAIGLMTILVGMIFGTAHTSLALGNTIVKTQNEEMLHQAFFELLSRRFASLPGNTRFDLKVSESGSPYISDITLQNVPLSFTWGGRASTAQAVQLSTVKKRSGYLDIVLRYYEEEILENPSSPVKKSATPKKPIAEIVLLTDVAYFEWRVLDGRAMNWQYDWDQVGRLPLQLELTMSIGARGEEIRHIFWVVPKVNPQSRIAQIQSNVENANIGGGGALQTTPPEN
jgi:prepilin-type N-terminal cleavage/methylation domain-containing protein